MCQLLGMNCNTPTDICFSFAGFRARGGLTDEHRDGWGIAFFEDAGVRLFLDSQPSAESRIADLVRQYPIRSENVIAHIRKATQGAVRLENTHPFQRELWGRYWVFAHNGNLQDFQPALDGRFTPVGNTDSERAFCLLLQTLAQRHPQLPTPEALAATLAEVSARIARHGTFNYLLSCGEALYAHCSTRLSCVVRQAPFTHARLADADLSVDFSQHTHTRDRVAVIATTPLTVDENWQSLTPGSLTCFRQGLPVSSHTTWAAPVPAQPTACESRPS